MRDNCEHIWKIRQSSFTDTMVKGKSLRDWVCVTQLNWFIHMIGTWAHSIFLYATKVQHLVFRRRIKIYNVLEKHRSTCLVLTYQSMSRNLNVSFKNRLPRAWQTFHCTCKTETQDSRELNWIHNKISNLLLTSKLKLCNLGTFTFPAVMQEINEWTILSILWKSSSKLNWRYCWNDIRFSQERWASIVWSR